MYQKKFHNAYKHNKTRAGELKKLINIKSKNKTLPD
jgi:ribosomal protein S17E